MDLELVTEEEAQDLLTVRKRDKGEIRNRDISEKPLVMVDKLPSGFKGYPEGTTISYNPITLGELEAINNGDNIDVERGVAMLLNNIHCNTLNSYDLYYWDVMYIGIKRKLLAFGDTTGIAYEICPKCGNLVKREFDYTELEFKELQVPDLPVITKINNTEVEIGLLTMKEFLELSEGKTDLDVYASMIKNLKHEQALELVKNAYGKDAKLLRYIDNILNYGLKPLTTKCDNKVKTTENKKTKEVLCGEEVKVEVKSPFEIVFPEDTNARYSDFEIQFGRK